MAHQDVNCNESHSSVQLEIDKVKAGRDTTIFIVGFCEESVNVVKDGITLSGNQDGVDIIGGGLTEVTVTGAQRVNIEYLELTGSGIDAFVGAFIRSSGNYIADNGYTAIEAGNMAYFRSFGGDIMLQKGCAENEPAGSGSTCGDEGTVAIDCYRMGMCDFRGTDVTGISSIPGLSHFDVRNSTINGDIFGHSGSGLRLRNSVTGSGIVHCDPYADESFALCSIPYGGSIH